MQIKDLQLKRALRAALIVLLLNVVGMTKMQAQNINFADANVKALCVANWDTDGDGELSQAEAAAVTSLDDVFMFDDEITTFDELSFFIGLASIGEDEFNSCTSLTAISIPNAVLSIGNYAFSDCTSLASITTYACTPPTLGSNVFDNVPSAVVVNVPCHTSAMYQAVEGWSDFSNYEEFEYGLCPISFTDANVKAICVAHWDSNGDGELSYAEAAAVTNLGTYFKSTAITSFDELEYFTSLTALPNTAFYGCTSLASIALPSSVLALGNGSFYNCTNLATMTVYAETPPTVGTNAFKNVPFSMVVYVPCGTYDAYHTANGWSEFNIIQQSGLCPIVFADANVKAICVANWDTNGDGELSYDEAAAVTDLGEVFRNTSINSFNELQYFYNLTSIGDNAFYWCSSLNSIEIPNSVTSIGNSAFYYCRNLTSIEIPSSVTYVGSRAFFSCTSITAIEIPSSLISIAYSAFNGCSGLVQIIVDSGNVVYDSRENCNAIIKTSNNELVTGCKNTEIPNSVTSIGDEAFIYCTGLTAIEIPSSVTSIGYFAFGNCTAITTIEIQGSVTSIRNNVFCNCTSLSAIEIPSSVTYIGSLAFYNCSSLTAIEIPSSVISIGDDAFAGCRGLTAIEIPSSVTNMGRNPFMSCINLDQIIVDSGNTIYDSRGNCNAIIKTSNNKLVIGCKNTEIPNSVTAIGDFAFCGCSSLISVEIPSSVTSIEYYAFSSCRGLTSVEIPSSVTSIGGEAFRDCTGLTSMTILSNNPPALGAQVFYNINSEIPVYVPCVALYAYQNTPGWDMFTNYLPAMVCNSGEITVTANPTEGGTITGEGSYEGGATCTLTAIANHGYSFIYWTEDDEMVSWEAEYTFTVAGDRNLIANFVEIPPVPVIAEYYPDPNEPNSPYVKVHWAASSFEALIGNETNTTYTSYMPFYTFYNYSISEALYTAAELAEAGLTTALMTSLSWEAIEVTTNQTQNNISIWMANVPDTELTNTSHLASNMTLVYTGNIGIPQLGWNEFVFNEGSFVWDGTSNVLILCQRNNGQWNGRVNWRSHNPGFNGMAYKYQDNTPYNAAAQTYVLNCSNTSRPNIIMKAVEATTYLLYRANCDGTGTQLIAENLSETEYIDATWWQLENDSYKYGVSVADSTNTEIFWSNCIENNYNPTAFHFITSGTWSTPANWLGGALPNATDEVFIDAPCQLDQNATVTALTVSDGQSLTLQSGKTLTVTGNLSNTVATSLVIEDGAQLIHNVANVQATVKKLITPFNGTSDSWHLIALPLTGSSNVASVTNLLEGEYDLYGYDEATTYWKNRKTTGSGFTVLQATKGYLYANGEEVTLGFSGTLENSSATITVPLSFTDGAHLSGFNLVGNPFPCNAYLNREYYILTTDGTDINPEPIPATTPIPPCTAVFVKAVAVGETVVFTRVVQ